MIESKTTRFYYHTPRIKMLLAVHPALSLGYEGIGKRGIKDGYVAADGENR